ncbi:unnamed protein product, partial [marine sediment metagenome]
MVRIQDTTQSFTITLIALLEGKGVISYIEVRNITKEDNYTWDEGRIQA